MNPKTAFTPRALLQVLAAASLLCVSAAHADYVYKRRVPSLNVAPVGSQGSSGSSGSQPSAGNAQLSSSTVVFDDRVIGGSDTKAVSILNSGGSSVDLTSIAVTAGAGDFQATHGCGAQLSAGASCDVNISFSPSDRGARKGTLTVVAASGTLQASLSGQGLAPAAVGLSSSSLSFAAATVGALSAEVQTLEVTNDGDLPLAISSVSMATGGSAYNATGCVGTLPAGGSCSVTLRFTPQAASNPGTLRIVSNAGSTDVPVSGAGTLVANASLSATSISFASFGIGGTSAETKTVTVTNDGGAPLTISSASIVAGASSFTASGCVGTVAAGNSCTITLGFKPQAASNTGTLRIVSNAASGASQDVSLSGAGTSAPLLTVTTADPVFASSPIGYLSVETKTVTLKNTGTSSLSVSSIAFSPTTAVFAKTGNCTSLAANASCSVTLSFTPSAVSNTANLRITSNAVNTPTKDVPVSGTGRTAGTMTITKAVYNYNATIGSAGNLTTKLKAVCDGKSQCTFDPYAVLGTDPSPYNPKNLELTYTCTSTGATVQSYSAGAEAGLRNHTLTCP